MTAPDLAYFTDVDLERQLEITIEDLLTTSDAWVEDEPIAVLLGGQSGAGKTTLHAIIGEELCGNIIVINGDEYRSTRPHFEELNEMYGKSAVDHTAKWSGALVEALIDTFSDMGYNLVIEGTLRTAEVPTKTAQLLRSRGYSVSLALMGVKPEISLVSCQIRYEQMRITGTVPRATDPKHHNLIVHEIVNNLATLEESGLFDNIWIYGRDKSLLYSTEEEGASAASASAAMNDILFGPWTLQEEEHLAYLQNWLDKLRNE